MIGRYESKSEALAVEATLINWVYGHSELKNINRGHGHQRIRLKSSYDRDFDLDPPVPGDGRAAENRRKYLHHAGTTEAIDYIRQSMEQQGYEVFEYDSGGYDSRYFPTLANGEYGFICHVKGIDFIIKSRENNMFNVSLANTPSTDSNIHKLKRFQPNLEIREPNNTRVNGLPRFRGMKYPKRIPIDNFREFMDWFEPIADHLRDQ
ncbi:hypothetical protein [Pseudidiomarina terrestris]|uniref:hypothetical protein n=1 Tax=Pseudidiomarina terrestris TaxID=2820060 RepID=UPI0026516E3B|nr:hypothetical protein [Pseudidiomarina sp. 1ASP75-5]MDN7135355.1 hypothetical protein [Pseudidiomarina sp. 1ASP75-5]